jgi:hypothetical protein
LRSVEDVPLLAVSEAGTAETSINKGSDKTSIQANDSLSIGASVLLDEDLGQESIQLGMVGSEENITLTKSVVD